MVFYVPLHARTLTALSLAPAVPLDCLCAQAKSSFLALPLCLGPWLPLQQAQLLAQERQHTGGNDACASSSGRGSGEGGSNGACEQHTALSSVDAPIKFPWRLASYYLTQMKEKRVALDRARQLYGDD